MLDKAWWTETDFHPSVIRHLNVMTAVVAVLVVAQIVYWVA